MNKQNQPNLAEENVGKLMRGYAVPCIISLLVGALYNIVDQIFIANAPYLGSYGNAANTVVFPLTVIALGIAVMIGDGCCAFVSISLGSQNAKNAKRSVGNSILMCVVGSIVLTVVYLIFSKHIINAFGGNVNSETFRLSEEYFFWITPGIPFYMFGQAMNPIIRADGSPAFAMVSTLIGAVALIIVEAFPNSLIKIFGAANESVYYTEFAVKAFRVYLCMIVLACINKAAFIFLQAMGRAVQSTMLSMVREIVFGVGLALLLPRFFGLDGVLYSMPVSDILTAIISAVIIIKTYRQLNA